MSPWFPFEPPFVLEARTKDDVLFGMRRMRYVIGYYLEVHGAASVLRTSPQEVDDATGEPYPPTTEGEMYDQQ